MLAKPGSDASGVEPVFAGKLDHESAKRYFIHANAAVGFSLVVKHRCSHGNAWEGGNGSFGGRTRRCVAGMLFHKLGDDAVESFLGIDGVAGARIGRIEKRMEER